MPPSRSSMEEAEVDQIINRHKSRLEQHRRFLDGDGADQYTSPSLDVDPSKWRDRQHQQAAAVKAQHLRQQASAADNTNSNSPRPRRQSQPNSPRSQAGTEYLHRESSTFGGQSFATREAQVEKQAAPSASRYVTDSPNRMHERSKAWLAAKDQKLMRNAGDVWNDVHAECTFQPRTATREYEEAHQYSHYQSAVTGMSGGSVIDVGEANFLERQRIARERKQEAERRLVPDTTRWQNRVTKPKEFELNRRGDSFIPALKKPCFSPPRQNKVEAKKDEDGASPQITLQNESGASIKVADSSSSVPAPKTPRGSGGGGGVPSSRQRSPVKGDSSSIQRTHSAASSRISAAGDISTTADAQRIILEKDSIIEDLRNQLDLSRRELEVARNTIRELSLA